MPDAYTTFYSSDMLLALRELSRLRGEAASVRPEIAVELTRALVNLERDLLVVSERTAKLADARIRDRIKATASKQRTVTERPFHLTDGIVSEPLPLGGVAVGILSELDKVRNPEDGGTYWRTQEEGSVAVGNRMTGRVLYGRFVGQGYSEVPVRGARGPGSEFMFGVLSGDTPGFGTIQHEIQPRHFLRDGSLEAFGIYREEVKSLSRAYGKRVAALAVFAAV